MDASKIFIWPSSDVSASVILSISAFAPARSSPFVIWVNCTHICSPAAPSAFSLSCSWSNPPNESANFSTSLRPASMFRTSPTIAPAAAPIAIPHGPNAAPAFAPDIAPASAPALLLPLSAVSFHTDIAPDAIDAPLLTAAPHFCAEFAVSENSGAAAPAELPQSFVDCAPILNADETDAAPLIIVATLPEKLPARLLSEPSIWPNAVIHAAAACPDAASCASDAR